MIKVVQFGEGNFLRTFADLYFDTLNKEGYGDFQVNIIKPIPAGSLENFVKQNNKYSVVLRGMKDGKAVEDIYAIDCLGTVFSPYEQNDLFYEFAKDKDVKIVVSNTTEAGICFNPNDTYENCEGMTFPARVTKFLYTRFKNGLPGLYFLPVELIENNATELARCIDEYIKLWNLGDEFYKWNKENNYFCNTLVDRIVSGHPRDEVTKKHIFDILGHEDNLVSIGEPFGLWVIENKGQISSILKDGTHNIDVIFTDNIAYYKKRKVRVLNGSHTNLVPYALWLGKETVYDCVVDPVLSKFVDDTLENDIIPFVSDDIAMTTKFANDVKERFLNPFLNHQLTSIALNSISKWKARDLPSFVDYYNKFNKIPTYLTLGFAYLVNMYMRIRKDNDKYVVDLPSRTIEVKDDLKCLEYFFNGETLSDFMKDESLWGVDLTKFEGFLDTVNDILFKIEQEQ